MRNIFYILLFALVVKTLFSYNEDLININSFDPLTEEDSITVRNLMFKTENFIRKNEKLLVDYINLCKNDTLYAYNIYRLVDTECFHKNISDNDSAKFLLKNAINNDFNMQLSDTLLIKYNLKDNYGLFKHNFCNLAKKVSNQYDENKSILEFEIRINYEILFLKKRKVLSHNYYAGWYLERFVGFNHVLNKYQYFSEVPENYYKDKFEFSFFPEAMVLYYPLVLDNIYYGEISIVYDLRNKE